MRVTPTLTIDQRYLEERFVRASGPGGQNVNKVSTAVELRLDLRDGAGLPAPALERLGQLAGRRLTDDGVLVIRAERFRTQERNRDDARARLLDLVRQALEKPKPRIATKPSRAVKARRLDAKGHRSGVKHLRRSKPTPD